MTWGRLLCLWNLERLPFVLKTRKFPGEFRWNGSSWWTFSGKKVIPYLSRYYLFSVVTETTEIFCNSCWDYQCQKSIQAQFKPVPVFCSKKIRVPCDGKFSPEISLQMVNAICLKMGHAFFLIGLVPGVCVCSLGRGGGGVRLLAVRLFS